MKRSKLEKLLLKSRLTKALYKAGHPYIKISGDKNKLTICGASVRINGQDIIQEYDFSEVTDYLEAANSIILNLEPEIQKAAPDLDYGFFS